MGNAKHALSTSAVTHVGLLAHKKRLSAACNALRWGLGCGDEGV
jgi:hypothetical protein